LNNVARFDGDIGGYDKNLFRNLIILKIVFLP
jgi:hypothetical protein